MSAAQRLDIHLSSLEREGWELDRCLEWISRMGIDFFEAGPKLPEEWRRPSEVRQMVDRHSINFTALEVSAQSWESLPHQLQWATEAGCRQIVLTGLELDHAESVYPQIAATAERSGVVISVDLWGAMVWHAEELSGMLEKIDSPWIQVAIDTGRVLSAGRDPLELAVAFEGRLGHFRIRSGSRETSGEPVLRSIFELLLDGYYRGGLGIMDESGRAEALATRVEEVRRTLELTIPRRGE